jgi:3-oxoacyl-[acyl-carrier-protein] synthase II
MEKITIVSTSTIDPITDNSSLSKIKNCWTYDLNLSFGEIARKAFSKIPLEMRESMESLIFCTLSSDEQSRAQIYKDISEGKVRSKPSIVLEAAGLNTRISLCGDIDANPDIYNVQAACATGLKALELGSMTALLKDQVVIVGACDKMTTDFNLTFFNSLGAISKSENFYGPFDKNRSGFAMGVGAAFVVLCTESKAKQKGWEPIAYVDSVVSATKPVHPTNPSDVKFISNLVEKAIRDSGRKKVDFAHWNAHATCTPMGDDLEYKTFLEVFNTQEIPISSLKGRIGHTMGPSALIELIHGINNIKDKKIFTNDRLVEAIETDPRIIRKEISTDKKTIIKTSFGFGGRNSVAVVSLV